MNMSDRTIRNFLTVFTIMLVMCVPSNGFTREKKPNQYDPEKYEKYLPSGKYEYDYGSGMIVGTVTLKRNINNVNHIQVINSNVPDISKMLMIIDETTFEGITSYEDLKVGDDVIVSYTWVKIKQYDTEIDMADIVSVPSKIKRSKDEKLFFESIDHWNGCSMSQGANKKECMKALELLTKAIAINPKYIKAYFSRAEIYQFLKEVDKGLNDYKKVLQIDPNNKEVYGKRAKFYLEMKQCAKAVEDFDMDFKINSNTDNFNRAEAYYCIKNYKRAAEEYSLAISYLVANSGDGDYLTLYYFYRGCAYIKSDQKEKGLQDFAKVLKLVDNFERRYAGIIKPYMADKEIKKFFNLAKGIKEK